MTQINDRPHWVNGQKKNQGQIIIEYVLLLIISVIIATMLINSLVGRGDNNDGIIIARWKQWIKIITIDNPDIP